MQHKIPTYLVLCTNQLSKTNVGFSEKKKKEGKYWEKGKNKIY